jgi:hypothetical protein
LPAATPLNRDDHVLDSGRRIDAMLIQQVDALEAEALELFVDGLSDTLGAVHALHAPVAPDPEAESRRDDGLVAALGQRPATSRSLLQGPYTSAVSMRVRPQASAA